MSDLIKLSNELIAEAAQENCDSYEYDLMQKAAFGLREQHREIDNYKATVAASNTVMLKLEGERDELSATVERLRIALIKSQNWDWLSAKENNQTLRRNTYQSPEMQELHEIANSTPPQKISTHDAELALSAVLHAADESRRNCWSIDELTANAEQVADDAVRLANTQYPSGKDGE